MIIQYSSIIDRVGTLSMEFISRSNVEQSLAREIHVKYR